MLELNTEAGLTKLRQEVDQVLSQIGEKHGLKFKLGRITYIPDGTECWTKLTVLANSDDAAKQRFANKATLFDLPADAYGKEIKKAGLVLKLVGINERARKYPGIGLEKNTGKRFNIPLAVLHEQFGRASDSRRGSLTEVPPPETAE